MVTLNLKRPINRSPSRFVLLLVPLVVAGSLLLWGAGAEAIAATYYGKEHARRKMKYLEIIADI